jgi:SNF family Na+-dependent transporter
MPLLFIFGVILMLRVITLGAPDTGNPGWNIANGFGFLWNPDFSALRSPRVWLEAAGQIFFTLSVGIGVILTYASYLSKGDDVVLSGLTAASTNELAEVILGGSIVIPAAFVFFGPIDIKNIAASGVFNLGFVTMPLILNWLPLAAVLGFIWFFLLFLAGITSSVSLAQPAVAFLEDEFDISRRKAVLIFAAVAFVLCHPAIFFLKNGVVDELDFWGGTFFLVVFATVEVVLFAWVFGMEKAWDEIHQGADMRIPKVYKFIIKYITPLFLFFILGMWFFYKPEGAAESQFISFISMNSCAPVDRGYILGTRLGLGVVFFLLVVLVKIAWRKKRAQK